MSDAIDPWELTRIHPTEYSYWQEEARDGDTLLGFAEWLNNLQRGEWATA